MEFGGTTVSVKEYDVVIVGGGGSGLRASLEISKSGQNVAVVSKVLVDTGWLSKCSGIRDPGKLCGAGNSIIDGRR